MKCPICQVNELHEDEGMRALSRISNMDICDPCATEEALQDELESLLDEVVAERKCSDDIR